MKRHRQQLVEDFVRDHSIHLPHTHLADIGRLKRLFRPRTLPATRLPCPAMALIPAWDTITETTPVNIFLRRDLTEVEMRLGYTHEIMHAVLGHRGSVMVRRISPWFHDRDEREAWEATAIALIPTATYLDSPNVQWLSRVAKVPEWLIGMHPLANLAGLDQQARTGVFR